MFLYECTLTWPRSTAPRGSKEPPPTPKNRRGDIHSTVSITPTQRRQRTQATPSNATPGAGRLGSDGSRLGVPSSSAPNLSAPAAPTDEPDEIRAIWGTTVNLTETMKTFRDFLRGFKIKYRVSYDRKEGNPTRTLATPEEGEVLTYEAYCRRLRQTGETNLNLDVANLLAYPPSKKLHSQLVKYPQEVIPAMDQVLKDTMLDIAEFDMEHNFPGMQGQDGEAEITEIMGRIYKVRPFGLPTGNMRLLNPSGAFVDA